MTDTLMAGLLVTYVVVAICSAVAGRWPLCLYWIGAAILTAAVVWMDARATEVLK